MSYAVLWVQAKGPGELPPTGGLQELRELLPKTKAPGADAPGAPARIKTPGICRSAATPPITSPGLKNVDRCIPRTIH